MDVKELASLIHSGGRPIVTFKANIVEAESFAEEGMRARVTGITFDNGCLQFSVDFSEFEEFNKDFETANYFDEKGKPTRTAREAGFYTPQDTIYWMADSEPFFTVLDELNQNSRIALHKQYTEEKTSISYIEWLENKVINSQLELTTGPTL